VVGNSMRINSIIRKSVFVVLVILLLTMPAVPPVASLKTLEKGTTSREENDAAIQEICDSSFKISKNNNTDKVTTKTNVACIIFAWGQLSKVTFFQLLVYNMGWYYLDEFLEGVNIPKFLLLGGILGHDHRFEHGGATLYTAGSFGVWGVNSDFQAMIIGFVGVWMPNFIFGYATYVYVTAYS